MCSSTSRGKILINCSKFWATRLVRVGAVGPWGGAEGARFSQPGPEIASGAPTATFQYLWGGYWEEKDKIFATLHNNRVRSSDLQSKHQGFCLDSSGRRQAGIPMKIMKLILFSWFLLFCGLLVFLYAKKKKKIFSCSWICNNQLHAI